MWRGQAGDRTGAATGFEQLLTDLLRVLGPDHPNTLTTRGNLAMWQRHAVSAQMTFGSRKIEVILKALMAGAAAGAKATTSTAVVDAYTTLLNLVRRALGRRNRPAALLDAIDAAPGTWHLAVGTRRCSD
jgi:hypothetical protein